ncbi:MAG: hypothetical protein M0R17_00770 [Candidatus Omnitrophica bacterium]|jgi:hypothetical protein|nr:hypothetical protein [Candidatus Omnitrophota bacterium]
MKIAYNGFLYESKINPSVDELREKYEQDPDVYFSYRDINKIGINPKSKWETPNGIYAYNVEDMEGKVPEYTSEAKNGYVYFIKPRPGTIKLDLQHYSEANLVNDLEKLKVLGFSSLEMHDIESGALFKSPGGYIWYATMEYSKNANNWNSLLRKLGYDYVVDHHRGIIHTNEPAQAVFLSPTSYNVIDVTLFDKTPSNIVGKTKVDLFNYIKSHPNLYDKITYEEISQALYNSSSEKVLRSFDEIPKFYEYKLNNSGFFDSIPDKYKIPFASKFRNILSRRFSTNTHCMFGFNKKTIIEMTSIFYDELQQLSEKNIDWIVDVFGEFKFNEYIKYIENFQSELKYGIENNASSEDITAFILVPTSMMLGSVLHMDNVNGLDLAKLLEMFKNPLISAENKLHWIEHKNKYDESLSSDVVEYIKEKLEILN